MTADLSMTPSEMAALDLLGKALLDAEAMHPRWPTWDDLDEDGRNEYRLRAAAQKLRQMDDALAATMCELWHCAEQLKCDWKDSDWRKRSSVGRAYDAARRALEDQGDE